MLVANLLLYRTETSRHSRDCRESIRLIEEKRQVAWKLMYRGHDMAGHTQPIAIEYRLSESEFMEACNAHWSAVGQGRTNVIAGWLGVAVGLGLSMISPPGGVILIIAAGLLLALTWVRSLLWRRAFRDEVKYKDAIRLAIDEDALRVETAEGTSILNWGAFRSYLDTSDYVLLYITRRRFSIIPKRAFPDRQSIERFLAIVSSHSTSNGPTP